jgi:hypothetical protein
MRAALRLRAAPGGGIDLLAPDPAALSPGSRLFLRFSQAGSPLNRIVVGPPVERCDRWAISDFVIDPSNGCYLLETSSQAGGVSNHLRKLDGYGKAIWRRSGILDPKAFDPVHLKGSLGQLIVDRDCTPYLPFTNHKGLVQRVDPLNGDLQPYADWGDWTGEVFMDGGGRIFFVRYLDKSGKRAWVSYDPRTLKETAIPCTDDVYPHLASPIAVDDAGRCYAVFGKSIACIGGRGAPVWQARIDNAVYDEKAGLVYTSAYDFDGSRGEIQIEAFADGGDARAEIRLRLPSQLTAGSRGRGNWRLIGLDPDQRYQVYGEEPGSQRGKILLYSASGDLEAESPVPPELHLTENSLQPARSWVVDPSGNLYLPLLGTTGFHVVKVTHL